MKNILILGSFIFISIVSFGQIQIKEAKLGKDVQNREVTEEATTFPLNSKVYLWMRTTGGTGTVTITWKNGNHSNTKTLDISGNPWRTWAYATGYYSGKWTVTVTDDKGTILKEMTFTVQ